MDCGCATGTYLECHVNGRLPVHTWVERGYRQLGLEETDPETQSESWIWNKPEGN